MLKVVIIINNNKYIKIIQSVRNTFKVVDTTLSNTDKLVNLTEKGNNLNVYDSNSSLETSDVFRDFINDENLVCIIEDIMKIVGRSECYTNQIIEKISLNFHDNKLIYKILEELVDKNFLVVKDGMFRNKKTFNEKHLNSNNYNNKNKLVINVVKTNSKNTNKSINNNIMKLSTFSSDSIEKAILDIINNEELLTYQIIKKLAPDINDKKLVYKILEELVDNKFLLTRNGRFRISPIFLVDKFNLTPNTKKENRSVDKENYHNIEQKSITKDISLLKGKIISIIENSEMYTCQIVEKLPKELKSNKHIYEALEMLVQEDVLNVKNGKFKKNEILLNNNLRIHSYVYKEEARIKDYDDRYIKLDTLKQKLSNIIYFSDEVKNIYKNLFPNSKNIEFDYKDLLHIGFRKNGHIIYSTKYKNIGNCFSDYLLENDILFLSDYLEMYIENRKLNNILQTMINDLVIIEFEPKYFIKVDALINKGINKYSLLEYGILVKQFIGNKLFTIKSLRKQGFKSKLDQLGFGDFFFESLLKNNKMFSFKKISKTYLFGVSQSRIHCSNLLKDIILEKKKLEINYLKDYILNEYGLFVKKNNLIKWSNEKGLYYSPIMEKVYIEYDEFLKEI